MKAPSQVAQKYYRVTSIYLNPSKLLRIHATVNKLIIGLERGLDVENASTQNSGCEVMML